MGNPQAKPKPLQTLPNRARERNSLSLKRKQERTTILTDNIILSRNVYELLMINFGLKQE